MIRKNLIAVYLLYCFTFFTCNSTEDNYTIEYVGGVKYIHNDVPLWNGKPKVRLEKVRVFSSEGETDDNYLLFLPRDVEVDSDGNIYIFDHGSRRIQIYDPEGNYLRTFGRRGLGPGEIDKPWSFGVDDEGRVLIMTYTFLQIFDPDGTEIDRTYINPLIEQGFIKLNGTRIVELPNGLWQDDNPLFNLEAEMQKPLVRIFDLDGTLIKTIGKTQKWEYDGRIGVIRSVFMDSNYRKNINI